MIDYKKRLVEVDIILKHLDKSDYEKIPKKLVDVINKNRDKEYVWKYDESKKLKDQDISRDTLAILSYLNMNYLLNAEQKEYIYYIYNTNQKKSEIKKDKKYNIDNLFKKKNPKTREVVNE